MVLPEFFKDDSNSDKFEETIDFFMSWTIRCADMMYEESFPIVNSYSKTILSKLLSDEDLRSKKYKDVKVWKQSGNIDLWIEYEILPDQRKKALIIENKMYSSIRPGQLEKYKEQAIEHYRNEGDREIDYVLLRPDYEINNRNGEKAECEKLGYRYINLEELQGILPKERTGNDLFDEFWFNW